MSMKLTYDTLEDLRDAIALVAVSARTSKARLALIQRMLVNSGDSAMLAGLPSGQFRKALTSAMAVHQTKDGRKYPSCILCGHPVSNDNGRNFPSAESLITLIPSSLFADKDTLSEVSPGSAPRLGFLPGNVALACKACADWKASREASGIILSADIIDAESVLMSWAGISASKASVTESVTESLARRKASRDIALGIA